MLAVRRVNIFSIPHIKCLAGIRPLGKALTRWNSSKQISDQINRKQKKSFASSSRADRSIVWTFYRVISICVTYPKVTDSFTHKYYVA